MKKIFTFLFAVALTTSLWATQTVVPAGTSKLSAAISAASTGDTLVLVSGTYTENSSMDLKTKALSFIAGEGTQPVVDTKGRFKVNNAIYVEGITFIGGSSDGIFTFVSGTEYDAVFEGCTFKNFAYAIRYYTTDPQLNKLTVNNCLFDTYTGYVVYAKQNSVAPGPMKEFKMTNTTILNGGTNPAVYICDHDKNFSTDGPSIIVDHCTLYKNASGNYTLQAYYIGAQAKFSNCIVSNPSDAQAKYAYYGYDGNTVKNCIWYNCSSKGARDYTVTSNLTNADPLFVDAANGDFTLAEESPAIGAGTDGKNLGDPRWTPKEDPKEDPIIIIVDGDASDWAGVPMLTEPGTYPIIRAIPASGFMANTLSMYYMYQDTATFADNDFPKLYVDADSNPTTGSKLGSSYVNFGYDYSFTSGYGSWTDFTMSTSDHVMEIAIDKAAMPEYTVPYNVVFDWNDASWTRKWRYPKMPDAYDWTYGESKYYPVTFKNFEMTDFESEHTSETSYARFTYMGQANPANFNIAGSSKDTIAWISWPVNFKKSAAYTVSADITATTDGSCNLYLYDIATNELVSQFLSGQKSAEKLQNAGVWDLSNVPVGKYMLVMRNNVPWANMQLNSVTLTYDGGAIVQIPDTLLPADAILTGNKISKTEAGLTWTDNVADQHYATWNINAAKGGVYEVIMNVSAQSPNGHKCSVALYDGAEQKAIVSEAAQTDATGAINMGNITINEAGAYMIRLNNATDWSNAIVESVELIYKGGATINLPGTLLPIDLAELSEYSFVDNDSIIFYTRGAEGYTPQGWAKWNVKVTTKAKYSFTANICSTNGHQFQVSVIGADTIYQKSVKSYSTGDKAMDLGYTVLEPGNYTIQMRNILANSKGRLMSVVVNKGDLPTAVTITEEATDNSVLMSNQNTPLTITLTRSLTDGMFNTLCLPFDVAGEQLDLLNIDKLCYLDKTTLTGDSVTLFFKDATEIEAGKPYIIMPTAAVANPVFEAATITAINPLETEVDHAKFVGTFTTTHLEAGNENLLYLGQNNTLYFPNENDTESMKGLRGYFEIKQQPGTPIRRASIHMGSNVVTTLDLVNGEAIPNNKFMLNGQIIIRANGQDYLLNGMQK